MSFTPTINDETKALVRRREPCVEHLENEETEKGSMILVKEKSTE